MKSLKESLFDRDLVTKDIIYHPKTKDELIECIKEQLKLQGPDADLNIIDVSKITDMVNLFNLINSKTELDIQNIDISKWDVKNVRYMGGMFGGCKKFNSDLSKWDVRNVEDMSDMFRNCTSFNSNLSKWDVSNVEDMSNMFYRCENFNSDLSKWNVSKVEDMDNMFYKCKNFNSDLSKWDVRHVKYMYYMSYMFDGCKSLKKIPSWYEKS